MVFDNGEDEFANSSINENPSSLDRIGLDLLDRTCPDGRPKVGAGVRKHPSRQEASSPRTFVIYKRWQNGKNTRWQEYKNTRIQDNNTTKPQDQTFYLFQCSFWSDEKGQRPLLISNRIMKLNWQFHLGMQTFLHRTSHRRVLEFLPVRSLDIFW